MIRQPGSTKNIHIRTADSTTITLICAAPRKPTSSAFSGFTRVELPTVITSAAALKRIPMWNSVSLAANYLCAVILGGAIGLKINGRADWLSCVAAAGAFLLSRYWYNRRMFDLVGMHVSARYHVNLLLTDSIESAVDEAGDPVIVDDNLGFEMRGYKWLS